MKRAGFTMIELIFVIVILGILGAVAIPKLSGVKDDAQLANANENICVNLKGPMMSYAVRHSGSLVGFDLSKYTDLNQSSDWTYNSGGGAIAGKLVIGQNLTASPDATALTGNAILTNTGNNVFIFLVDGNETANLNYSCMVGNDATGNGATAGSARTIVAGGSNYL